MRCSGCMCLQGAHIPPRADIVFSVELLKINGWGLLGLPYRMFKRLLRLIARIIIRLNILWAALKAFERRTHFFENIAVKLKLIKPKQYDEEDLDEDYDDHDVEYEDSDDEEESADYTGDSYTQDEESSQAEVEEEETRSDGSGSEGDDHHHDHHGEHHLDHPMFSHIR